MFVYSVSPIRNNRITGILIGGIAGLTAVTLGFEIEHFIFKGDFGLRTIYASTILLAIFWCARHRSKRQAVVSVHIDINEIISAFLGFLSTYLAFTLNSKKNDLDSRKIEEEDKKENRDYIIEQNERLDKENKYLTKENRRLNDEINKLKGKQNDN